MSKYYEISPNLETVSNQSHSFYFPPMLPVSTIFDIEYQYDKNDYNYSKYDNYQKLLDYTMISDEDCINLQMLFSAKPTKNNNNIVQFLKSEGIFPSNNKFIDNLDIHELQAVITDNISDGE